MTLVEMLERNAETMPGKTAIIFRDGKMNYKELNDKANKLANTLLKMGMKKGDRIGLVLPRVPELVVSFLAVAKAHGIVIPINYELTRGKVRAILENASPHSIIVHAAYLEHISGAIPEASNTLIMTVSGNAGQGILWDEVVGIGDASKPNTDIREDDVVYLNYTSGSTGDAKGAITTHANIFWNTVAAVEALEMTSEDVHLCMFAPFAHPHEIFARPLYLGGTMVLLDNIFPKSLAHAISTHKVTCMMGLAPMYENLLYLLEHKSFDLSSLRIPESGGMYTRAELIKRFKREVGVSILPVWGSTETTGIALANRPGENLIPGSIGSPCASYEVKIIDEEGNELPPDEIGEMAFRGPAVVQGYYEDTLSSQNGLDEGWYYSGDLGRRDGQGNFYFIERKTGMMKVAGLKVYPTEIEIALMKHRSIKEAAVISVKDRLRGEVPKAIVVLRDGDVLTEREVIQFCREELAHYKVPRIVEIRESLPKIGSGKINKKILQMESA